MTVVAITEQIRSYGIQHVVVTGGEPMLFDAVEALCTGLHKAGHIITIETAGTIYREVKADLMSISPKLANSTPDDDAWRDRHERTRLDREPLKQLLGRYNCQLKFVAEAPADLEEIDTLLAELPAINPERILVMPEGTSVEAIREHGRAVLDGVMQRGWRLMPRWHIDLFGNTKGT